MSKWTSRQGDRGQVNSWTGGQEPPADGYEAGDEGVGGGPLEEGHQGGQVGVVHGGVPQLHQPLHRAGGGDGHTLLLPAGLQDSCSDHRDLE